VLDHIFTGLFYITGLVSLLHISFNNLYGMGSRPGGDDKGKYQYQGIQVEAHPAQKTKPPDSAYPG